MTSTSSLFSGGAAGSNYRLRMECWQSDLGVAQGEVWVDRLGGSGYSGTNGYSGTAVINGVVNTFNGSSYNFTGGNSSVRLWSGTVSTSGQVAFRATAVFPTSSLGSAATPDGSVVISPPAPTTPPRPNPPGLPEVNPTDMLVASHRPIPNDQILEYEFAWNTDPGFSAPYSSALNPGYLYRITGLTSNTQYYVATRIRNASGWSPWSGPTSVVTMPTYGPTLNTVTPSIDGTSARLVWSPPAEWSADWYRVERRSPGSSWEGQDDVTGTAFTWSALEPGQTYEWRVRARIGSYDTPYSNVISLTQPKPSTTPGDFFNGDTPDNSYINYSWSGTAGASISTAQALLGVATGWRSGAEAMAATGGGTAIGYLVPVALMPDSGARSMRYAVTKTGANAGARFGTNGTVGYAEVASGAPYVGSIWVQTERSATMTAALQWLDAAGAPIAAPEVIGAITATPAGVPVRLSVLGIAPAGAMRARVSAADVAADRVKAGDTITVDAAMLSTGVLYPYFDGDTADSARYLYAWAGAQYVSISSRTDVDVVSDPLADPDCPPFPLPPQPPRIEDPCITPVGSWRRYWVSIRAENISEWLDTIPSLILETGAQPERQVRVRYYPNPDGLDPRAFTGDWESEQIVSFIPALSTVTIDGVANRTWAEVPSGASPIPADGLLYGTGGIPATYPVLGCGVSYLISLDTPVSSPAGNLTPRLELTVRS